MFKITVSGAGGLLLPRNCRITYGPNDSYFENLAGKRVASIRRCLASVFSIPDEAEPWVGGVVVGAGYRLRPGDSVEFLKRRGLKAGSPPDDLELVAKEGLTLSEAAALIPGRKQGKRVYVNTVWRWCKKGVKNGIRLKSVLVGGQRYTTRRWLQEFIEAMSQASGEGEVPPPAIRTPRQRQTASERAIEELKAAWKKGQRRQGEAGSPPGP